MNQLRSLLYTAVLGCLLWPLHVARAFADPVELEAVPTFVSPEHFVLEIRIGPIKPDFGDNSAFGTYFGDDSGPLFGAELGVIAWRIPDVLYLAGAGRIGTASFDGRTRGELNETTSEETTFSVLPLDLLAVVRVDVLPRKLSVPFILTGKLGYEWAHWSTDSGGEDEHSGWSVGLAWGAQLALDLDSLDSSAARTLDEEWGINHSFFFVELFQFEPSAGSLPIGDRTWTAGLGFVF
jgi:hypothetical protein